MNPLDLPLFVPSMVVVALVAAAGSEALGRATGGGRVLGAFVILSAGLVLAATVTPQATALNGEVGSGLCNLARRWVADPEAYLRVGETVGNVLLFLPLGVALALLPASTARLALIAGAVVLPIAVEAVQLLVPALDRACESADVIDNLLGLGIGLGIGCALRRVAPTRASGSDEA